MNKTILAILLLSFSSINVAQDNMDDIFEELIQKGYSSSSPLKISVGGEVVATLGNGSKLNWSEEVPVTLEIPADKQVIITRSGSIDKQVLEPGTYEDVTLSSLEYRSSLYTGGPNFVLDYKASPDNNANTRPSCLNVFMDIPGIDKAVKLNDANICVGSKTTLLASDAVDFLGANRDINLDLVSMEGIRIAEVKVHLNIEGQFILKSSFSKGLRSYRSGINIKGMSLTFDNTGKHDHTNHNYDWRQDDANVLNILDSLSAEDFK